MSLGGSLWLVPDPTSEVGNVLRTLITSLSSDDSWGEGVSVPFDPHMTITSGISDYFLSSSGKVDFPGYSFVHLDELQIETPKLQVKEVVFGTLFL